MSLFSGVRKKLEGWGSRAVAQINTRDGGKSWGNPQGIPRPVQRNQPVQQNQGFFSSVGNAVNNNSFTRPLGNYSANLARSKFSQDQIKKMDRDPLEGLKAFTAEIASPTNIARANPMMATAQLNTAVQRAAGIKGPNAQKIVNTGIDKFNESRFGHGGGIYKGTSFAANNFVAPIVKSTARFSDVTSGKDNYEKGIKGFSQYGTDAFNIGSAIYTPMKAGVLAKGGMPALKAVPGALVRGAGAGVGINVIDQLNRGTKIKDLDYKEALLTGIVGAGSNLIPGVGGFIARGTKSLTPKISKAIQGSIPEVKSINKVATDNLVKTNPNYQRLQKQLEQTTQQAGTLSKNGASKEAVNTALADVKHIQEQMVNMRRQASQTGGGNVPVFDKMDEAINGKPKVTSKQLQADKTYNQIESERVVKELQQLNQRAAALPNDTPEYQANSLEIRKRVAELQNLNKAGAADDIAKIEATRPKVEAKKLSQDVEQVKLADELKANRYGTEQVVANQADEVAKTLEDQGKVIGTAQAEAAAKTAPPPSEVVQDAPVAASPEVEANNAYRVEDVNPDGSKSGDSYTVEFPPESKIQKYRTAKELANSNNSGYVSSASDIVIKDIDGNEVRRMPYDEAVQRYGTSDPEELSHRLANGGAPRGSVSKIETNNDAYARLNKAGAADDIAKIEATRPKVEAKKLSQDVEQVKLAADEAMAKGDFETARVLRESIQDELKQAPTVEPKATPEPIKQGGVDSQGRAFDQNGEYIETPKPKATNVNQFIDELPDPKKTTRADADVTIGEGTTWMKKAGEDIDATLRANGDTYENFSRAINQASDDVKAGKTPNVSPLHQQLYDSIKPTLDRLRKESGVTTGETPYYLPRRRLDGGDVIPMGNSLVDALDAATFGSQYKRTGALGMDDIDHSPNALSSYATQTLSEKYRHSMAVDDLMQAADKRGKPISMEQASEAVDLQDKMVTDLADAAKKGKEATHDTVKTLNKLGEAEGLPQVANDYKPGVVTQSPEHMMERAGVWDKGFVQYDNAIGNGNVFIDLIKENKVPPSQFGDALQSSILKQMPNADVDSVNKIVAYTLKKMEKDGITPENANELVIRAFKNSAKDEMLRLGKTTRFSDPKMAKVVSEQINNRTLKEAHQNNLVQGLGSFAAERINVSLRGGNVVSAAFEAGDYFNILSNYGVKNSKHTKLGVGAIDGDTLHYSHKYGQGDIQYVTSDMPQINKWDKIWADPNTSIGSKIWQSYRTAENKLLLFRYVEQHKTEMFFRSAENFYKSPAGGSLKGSELVNAVMKDFNTTMLPHSIGTANRIVGKMPRVLTQYMNWGLQATKRLGRTVSGTNTAGKFKNMTRAGRIARGVSTELVPKVGAAVVLGVPIMQILGMRDYTGATNGDFTGIDDTDKKFLDEVVQLTSVSPAMSFAGNAYFAKRRNDIADQKAAAGEDYGSQRRPEDSVTGVLKQGRDMLIPFNSQIKKTRGVAKAIKQGYFDNANGRIQAAAPTNPLEQAIGFIGGKNYTQTMREYQDNPNITSVIKGKAKPQDLVTHNETVSNVIQTFGGRTPRDYNRPLSDSIKDKNGKVVAKGYTDSAKEAYTAATKKYGERSPESRKVMQDWVNNGREYNRIYDNLQRNNPEAFKTWTKTKEKDVLTPEKWKIYAGNKDVFEYDKQRKLLEKRDLNRAIDPIYELPKDRANLILQERSAYTGEDMKLRTLLYSNDWYAKNFKNAESKYFDSFSGEKDDSKKSKRVQEWNKMNQAVFSPETGVLKKYPLVSQYQKEIGKFKNYNSQERKDFTKAWYDKQGDAYEKQKENYDNERFNLVNKMRALEGVPALSYDEFKAKVEFPSDKADYKGYGYGKGGKAKVYSKDPNEFGIDRNAGGSGKFSASVKKVSEGKPVLMKSPGTGKPKVTIKKSLV